MGKLVDGGVMIARGSVAYGPLRGDEPDEVGPEFEAQAKSVLMPKIQKYAGADTKPEDVHVFMGRIANTKLISFGGEFNRKSLGELAALYPGRAVMFEHDYDQPQVGKFFDARVDYIDDPIDRKEENYHATVWGYVPANDPQGDSIHRRMKLRIFDQMSAAWAFVGMTCSICDSDMRRCGHWPMEVYEPGGIAKFTMEGVVGVYEGSIVYMGAAQGTTITPLQASAQQTGTARAFQRWCAGVSRGYGEAVEVEEYFDALKVEAGGDRPEGVADTLESMLAARSATEDVPAVPVRNRIVSVSCPKGRFRTQEAAASWCMWRSFRVDRAEATSDSFVFGQRDRKDFEDGSDTEVALERKRSDAVTATVGKRRMSGGEGRASAAAGESLGEIFSGV